MNTKANPAGLYVLRLPLVTITDFYENVIEYIVDEQGSLALEEVLELKLESKTKCNTEAFEKIMLDKRKAKAKFKRAFLASAYRELFMIPEGEALLAELHELLVPNFTHMIWTMCTGEVRGKKGSIKSSVKIYCNTDIRFFYEFMANRRAYTSEGELPNELWFSEK